MTNASCRRLRSSTLRSRRRQAVRGQRTTAEDGKPWKAKTQVTAVPETMDQAANPQDHIYDIQASPARSCWSRARLPPFGAGGGLVCQQLLFSLTAVRLLARQSAQGKHLDGGGHGGHARRRRARCARGTLTAPGWQLRLCTLRRHAYGLRPPLTVSFLGSAQRLSGGWGSTGGRPPPPRWVAGCRRGQEKQWRSPPGACLSGRHGWVR